MTSDVCSKTEYLQIQPAILDLAKKTLPPEKLLVAEQFSTDLISSKSKKERARLMLRRLVGVQPSRPLLYANTYLGHLPRFTRDPIRYVGDYIDHLVKFWSSEINGDVHLKKSMGANLKALK